MKKIVESASLIYAALIFIGYAQLHVYYGYYKIPIWSYMTFGEVLFSFMPLTLPLVAFLAVCGFMLILDHAPESLSDWMDWMREPRKREPGFTVPNAVDQKEPKWWSVLVRIWQVAELALLVWFGYVLLRMAGEILGHDYWVKWSDAQGELMLWAMVLLIVAMAASGRTEKRVYMQAWAWGMMVMGSLTICVWSAKHARAIKAGKPEFAAVLYTKQGVIESDSCFYYVGRTDNASFFWDKISGEWTAIKNSEVVREDIVELNRYPKPFD
jgi:hypothetical protein